MYVTDIHDYLDYKFTLEEKLEEIIEYPMDIKVLNEAPPWFIKQVCEEGEVLFSKKPFLLEKLYLLSIDELSKLSMERISQ